MAAVAATRKEPVPGSLFMDVVKLPNPYEKTDSPWWSASYTGSPFLDPIHNYANSAPDYTSRSNSHDDYWTDLVNAEDIS